MGIKKWDQTKGQLFDRLITAEGRCRVHLHNDRSGFLLFCRSVLSASALRSAAILPVYSPLSQALVIHCQGSVIGSPWLMLWEQILNEAAGAHSRAVVIRPDQVIQWFLAFLPPPRPGSSLNFIFPPPQFCTYTAHFLSYLFFTICSPRPPLYTHPTLRACTPGP